MLPPFKPLLIALLAGLCLLRLTLALETSGLSSRHIRRLARQQQLRDAAGDAVSALGSDYVFVPPEVGPEIYAGTVASLVPIVWATYEFTNRYSVAPFIMPPSPRPGSGSSVPVWCAPAQASRTSPARAPS